METVKFVLNIIWETATLVWLIYLTVYFVRNEMAKKEKQNDGR